MINDKRQEILAAKLVNYSCEVKPDENVLIETFGAGVELPALVIREVYKAGGRPFLQINENRLLRELIKGADVKAYEGMAKYAAARMSDMQAYIGIRGGNNSFELSDADPVSMQNYMKYYMHPVHHEIRVKKTKWVVLRYPTEGMSQLAGMSTEAYEDFYFNVCNLDYAKMAKAMDPLCALMNKTDKVRITGKGTDLSFSIKGIGSVKCAGEKNIPDGEVYSAPVKDSVNGVISYNVPSIENGIKFENVKLTFKNGKITEATASGNIEELTKIFDTDEGARYVGEFSFGLNPYITKAIGDILFDEKISGSIHFTPGQCYDDAYNGNQSAIHWDLVYSQAPEYGGGEIYMDGKLVRKDGRFVIPELTGLNPENLK